MGVVLHHRIPATPPDAQKKFNEFWNTKWITGQLVTGSSQQGYENATKFLVWMRGRKMNKGDPELAFSNLAAKGELHYLPTGYKLSAAAQKAETEKKTPAREVLVNG